VTSVALQCTLVIRSLKHRGLKRLYEDGDERGIRPDLVDTVEEILTVLDGAKSAQDLDLSVTGYTRSRAA
jgi:hypothetical protein